MCDAITQIKRLRELLDQAETSIKYEARKLEEVTNQIKEIGTETIPKEHRILIPIDTKIKVKNDFSHKWENRYFCSYDSAESDTKSIGAWDSGKTSFTTRYNTWWKYGMLAETVVIEGVTYEEGTLIKSW